MSDFLAEVTLNWGYVQIYGPKKLQGDYYEVRVPGYEETEDLMFGRGETFRKAVNALKTKMEEVEFETAETETSADVEMEGEAEVRHPEDEPEPEVETALTELFYAAPGGGKNHIFNPNTGESLCGRAKLGPETAVTGQPVTARDPDGEVDCKLCVDDYRDTSWE